MDFFIKHLEETIKAIKNMNGSPITVKRVRMVKDIPSSDRSQINFIWRTLGYLEEKGILEMNGSKNPKSYKVSNVPFDVEYIISQAKKDRMK